MSNGIKKQYNLKLKIILPVIFILVAVFLSSSFIIIDREYNSERSSLINGAYSFSSLSSLSLIDNYKTYYQSSGFYQYLQIVDDLMSLNENVNQIQILNINGKILFDTTELQTKTKYDEAALGERYVQDEILINRTIASEPSEYFFDNDQFVDIVQPYIDEWGRHDFSIRYVFSLSSLEEMRQETVLTILVSSGIFIVISFLLIFFIFNRFISNPIGKLIKGVRNIGKGNLGSEIKIKSQDEIGELSSAFNKMRIDLKKTQDSLKEYSENLEKLVTKRTEELEDKTANLEKINIDLTRARKELDALNKNLEKRIKERTNEVEQLLKQKDEFINQLSHDLKSPLNPLTILLPILEKQESDPKKVEIIQVLKRNVDYMRNIAIKTLELAKLNSPKTKFSLEKIDLSIELQRIIENKKTLFNNKNIEIKNNAMKNIFITADKLRLEELFSNLLENSIKYSNEKGLIILDAKKEKDFANISIKDNGIGMTKIQLKHVFEEFYKADSSRHDFESSGLGLSICKKIVERLGGKIWMESEGLGKGSTVFFKLPLYKDEELKK